MNITVAVCTWNRAALLDRTLARMRDLVVPPGVTWELLVVNNNCTDDTDAVVARHADHLPLCRLLETKQGHSNARNCAVRHARGELLIWTDDDVLVEPDWLAQHARAAQAFPDAGYFGGTVDPWFECEPPRWITRNLDRLEGVFAIRRLGPELRPLADAEQVFGANLAFRTHLLRETEFDPTLGRIGSGMLSGDETTLIARLREKGWSGVWVGPAKVKHFVPAARLTARYVREFFRGLGRTSVRAGEAGDASGSRLWGAPRWWYRVYLRQRWLATTSWLTGGDWVAPFLSGAVRGGMIAEFRASQKLVDGPAGVANAR